MSLSELRERVYINCEPCRALDADIWWTLQKKRAAVSFNNAALGPPRTLDQLPDVLTPGLGRAGVEAAAPRLTGSLDACIELGQRLSPGAEWDVTTLYDVCRAH